MAQKRMFTMQIVDSDAFLDMPLSAQSLYFHLNMRADDDGFVNNPKKIQRMIGASDDDLRILIMKRFVLAFNSGVIVIKHWRMHNYFGKTRYHPTQYQAELASLSIKENGAYTELEPKTEPSCFPLENERRNNGETTENNRRNNGERRLDKTSIDKTRLDETRLDKTSQEKISMRSAQESAREAFDVFWAAYPKKVGKKDAFKAFQKVPVSERPLLIPAIERQKQSRQWNDEGGRFIPNPSTWLNQGRWMDEGIDDSIVDRPKSRVAQELEESYDIIKQWVKEEKARNNDD